MPATPSVAIVIPALDEAEALPAVLRGIPRPPADRVVVVDNGSSDDTAGVARRHGAEVVHQPHRGYGRACLAGLAHLEAEPPDIVVVLDGDNSDHPGDLHALLRPLLAGDADMVCGSRVERARPGALPPHVRWGNRLATGLIRLLFGHRYRDMGPFRALRWSALRGLDLQQPTYGWNAEMQVKALQRGLRVVEVPVRYRRRIGRSKISGTLRGSVQAGALILWTIVKLRWAAPRRGVGAGSSGRVSE